MNKYQERIVFMGTPTFASKILKGLLVAGFNIVGVVCQPDKLVGRKQLLQACPVKQLSNDENIAVLSPERIRNDYQDILDLNPDLIITCAYGQIIPKQILDYPKYKCINVHASLLPKYRGASPIQSALLNGEDKTGITIMYMNEKMDEGDILFQEEMDIDIYDTNAALFDKLADLGLDLLLKHLPDIFDNNINPIKQNEELVTYASKLNKEIEFIDFNDNVINVYNHIRALLDEPGCYFVCKDKKYKIIKAFFQYQDQTNTNIFIGLENDYLRIDCLDGFIKIYEIKPEGKNTMNAKAFYNGVGRNIVGEKLG